MAPAPVRLHVTPLFAGSFETVAVIGEGVVFWLCSSVCGEAGARAMETGSKLIVKVTLLVPLATEVAVMVTVVAEGIVAGAV